MPVARWLCGAQAARAMARTVSLAGFVAAMLPVCAESALAQVRVAETVRVTGTVRDDKTKLPLARTIVRVDALSLSTETDSAGHFELILPFGGHVLQFIHGTHRVAQRALMLAGVSVAQVDVQLASAVTKLDSVRVVAHPGKPLPPGMEDRMRQHDGHFIIDTTLRLSEHLQLSMVLTREIPGLRLEHEGGRLVAMSRRGGAFGGRCFLTIFVDGNLIWAPDFTSGSRNLATSRLTDRSLPPDLDQFLVLELEAVEVYASADVPPQFRGPSAACGAMVLWTRTNRKR
jgi:hypothetical protein